MEGKKNSSSTKKPLTRENPTTREKFPTKIKSLAREKSPTKGKSTKDKVPKEKSIIRTKDRPPKEKPSVKTKTTFEEKPGTKDKLKKDPPKVKSGHGPEVKKKKRIIDPVNEQQKMAKEQAETLKNHTRKFGKPELAKDPNAGGSRALRLRLDLNLDAEITIKAKIKGSIILTLQ